MMMLMTSIHNSMNVADSEENIIPQITFRPGLGLEYNCPAVLASRSIYIWQTFKGLLWLPSFIGHLYLSSVGLNVDLGMNNMKTLCVYNRLG